MTKESPALSPGGEVVVYEASDSEVRWDVRLDRETVWLTPGQMAEVFNTSTDNVGLHLKNVYSGGELVESATTEDYSVIQSDGGRLVSCNVFSSREIRAEATTKDCLVVQTRGRRRIRCTPKLIIGYADVWRFLVRKTLESPE